VGAHRPGRRDPQGGGLSLPVRDPATGGFFGRRKGKKLRAGQSDRLARLKPALALDLDAPPPDDLGVLFPGVPDMVRLEIGFGGGEHLLHEAAAHPGAGFIGVEPFVNGMAKALVGIEAGGLANVRVSDADAVRLLDWLPTGSLGGVDLLYPDPWPKRRHWKRRFVSDANVGRLGRVLCPGGRLRFATDIDTYVEWTLIHLSRSRDFAWTAAQADDWRVPWPDWPGTRYEAKAIREGRRPTYLVFQRT
jgi:tRNA (guanine-N7-)-methyltransferase